MSSIVRHCLRQFHRPECVVVLGAASLFAAGTLEGLLPRSEHGRVGAIAATAAMSCLGVVLIVIAVMRAFRTTPQWSWSSAISRATALTGIAAGIVASSLLIGSNLVGSAWPLLFVFEVTAFWVIAPLWLIEVVVCAFASRRRRAESGAILRLSMPVVLVLTGAFVTLAGVPSSATYLVSRPQMDRYAKSVLTTESVGPEAGMQALERFPNRIGLLPIERVERYAGGVRFVVAGAGGFLDRAGYAYSTAGPPPGTLRDRYAPLSGHWWYWNEVF